jgi:hypothetical protein
MVAAEEAVGEVANIAVVAAAVADAEIKLAWTTCLNRRRIVRSSNNCGSNFLSRFPIQSTTPTSYFRFCGHSIKSMH